ncbi:MAG: alpha/beta hydrolase [Terracidiphilus sp.]|jgi:acetyl esterase/lipase
MKSLVTGIAVVALLGAALTLQFWQPKHGGIGRQSAEAQTTPPVTERSKPQDTRPEVIHLWENGAPGFEGRKDVPEVAKDYWVRNVNNPSITVYLPPKEKATGAGVVIAPGGGFRLLVATEGDETARFLNSIGVAAFVLKYRLPNDHNSPYTMENVRQDAYRAMRLVRSRAKEWNIDPHRVGMMGFSVGGYVISLIAYAPGQGDPMAPDPVDRLNGRPDFQIQVSGDGDLPDRLPPDSPPAFLIVANDDETDSSQATLELLTKLRAAGVRVEAVFLAWGKHSFSMGGQTKLVTVKSWPQRIADWMKDSGYLTPRAAGGPVTSHKERP